MLKKNLKWLLILAVNLLLVACAGDSTTTKEISSEKVTEARARYLRGAVTPERAWWDLQHYDLSIEFFPGKRTIKGSNIISFKTIGTGQTMQIDLQEPLAITKIIYENKELKFKREGNVYWVYFDKERVPGTGGSIEVFYEGKPIPSKNPPWSGGISWARDDLGEHFIATSCQGIGASIFWPNKDHGYDEPDRGVDVRVTVPGHLVAVSNGRLLNKSSNIEAGTRTYHWRVVNPINNYCVNVNIGNYVHFSEEYQGEAGLLTVDYWVLKHQLEIAKKHFVEVPRTLEAFEYWFGPYPFYEDGYKLVSVPYSGMEHQSSVTYGNWFRNGYRGNDESHTGIGFKFDFIIVHESGHEWFGNSITSKDSADLWIHESFINYSESLFVEYHFSEKEGQDYAIGTRENIKNDRPIIAPYNQNREGSGDMYPKGGNMLHTIRHIINDKEKFRAILRGLNQTFRHQTVTTAQVENYISGQSGIDFSKVFDQYLRNTKIPNFRYKIEGKRLVYHFEDVIKDFTMPLRIKINGQEMMITPTGAEQTLLFEEAIESVEVDRNFYIETNQIK